MLMKAPSQPRNPSRRIASSANEPSRTETLSSASNSLARRETGSRLRNRTEYFLSATRARTTGIPWAPVPPMTKIREVLCEDNVVAFLVLPALQALDDGGVGHAAALAHRLQAVPAAALFERVDQRGHEAGAAGAERVADRDGAAVDVGLCQIRAGVVGPRHHDGRERLVHLEQVDVVQRQPGTLQHLFGGG